MLCTGEPEERLHGCGGVLVVRSRMGSTTMVLVTLSALTTATIEQRQTTRRMVNPNAGILMESDEKVQDIDLCP